MKIEKGKRDLILQNNVKTLQVKEFVLIGERKQNFPYPTKFGRKYHILFFFPYLGFDQGKHVQAIFDLEGLFFNMKCTD